jgi:hypothetical protein
MKNDTAVSPITKTMRMFKYEYSISYGCGCGVVLAESKRKAKQMIRENPYATTEDLEIEEIDISKSQLVDHSWSE